MTKLNQNMGSSDVERAKLEEIPQRLRQGHSILQLSCVLPSFLWWADPRSILACYLQSQSNWTWHLLAAAQDQNLDAEARVEYSSDDYPMSARSPTLSPSDNAITLKFVLELTCRQPTACTCTLRTWFSRFDSTHHRTHLIWSVGVQRSEPIGYMSDCKLDKYLRYSGHLLFLPGCC